MAIDTSKVLLNGLLDYSGSRSAGQGLLDSDFTSSTICSTGGCGRWPATCSTASGSPRRPGRLQDRVVPGGLSIGVGRLYVDGRCAECHGAPSAAAADRVLDPVLDEARSQSGPYAARLLPPPPAIRRPGRISSISTSGAPRPHLDSPLVETAVGVDPARATRSSGRFGSWPRAGGDCATADEDLPGWADLIAPSSGLLTTGTYTVAPSADPCELPPTGGYRGDANQLYRVEIHNPGQPGAGATFKWSRENKSVGSRVVSLVTAGKVEVATIGRDDILSLKTGDWVEFTNDVVREFPAPPRDAQGHGRRGHPPPPLSRARLPADLAPGPFPDAPARRRATCGCAGGP